MKVKSLSHIRLFGNPMDCSPPGSSIHGIFQARVLEWGAIAFSAVLVWHLAYSQFLDRGKNDFPLILKFENHSMYCCCCYCQVASVVSDSVRPHRRQPIRLPRPWDSPGKNTGVGCHFLLQCLKVKSESEAT